MFHEFTPKPKIIRPKKAPKPLKRGKPPVRKTALKKMSKARKKAGPDPSNFRDADIFIVYVYPGNDVCFQTAKRATIEQPIDRHHLFGRGGKDPKDRRIHSSIFNCGLLRRDIHHGPMRDLPAQREAYLDYAIMHVATAIGLGAYMLTDLDREF